MSVVLKAGNFEWDTWKDVSVSRSLGQGARTFKLSAVNMPNPVLNFDTVPFVELFLHGQLAVTGSIDDDQAQLQKDQHNRQLSGRSLTGDLIDSSVIVEDNELRDMTIEEALQKSMSGFQSNLFMSGPVGEKFVTPVRPYIGETVFDLADRLSRERALIPTDNPKGDLVLFQQKQGAPVEKLEEGVNLKNLQRSRKPHKRHSSYIVKGQKPGTDQAFGENATIEARLDDNFVRRYRPKILQIEEPGSLADARQRADWEAARTSAEELSVSGDWVGWLRSDGMLWESGDLVHIVSPSLELDDVMQVESATSTRNKDGGEVTALQFTLPVSASPKAKKAIKSGGASPRKAVSPSTGQSFQVSDIWTTAKPDGQAQ